MRADLQGAADRPIDYHAQVAKLRRDASDGLRNLVIAMNKRAQEAQ